MQGMGTWGLVGYVVFFIALMYVMIFLPQKRREKKAREMISSMEVGNSVITIGGICGKILNIKDDEVTIETSVEKSQLVVKNWAVKEVVRPDAGTATKKLA